MRRIRWPQTRAKRIVALELAVVVVIVGVAGIVLAGGRLASRAQPSPAAGTPSTALSTPVAPSASARETATSPSRTAAPKPTAPAVLRAWALPAGWRYDLQCDDEEGSTCTLHLYDGTGAERPGWPVALRADYCHETVAVGPQDSVFLACERNGRAVVAGLGGSGRALPGWPVTLPGEVDQSIAVGPDGTVYLGVWGPGDDAPYAIHALAPDGTARPGWPRSLPGGQQGFTVALDGTVVAWWYEGVKEDTFDLQARRTVFTMLGEDGQTLPGWPQGSTGAASWPVVWRDTTMYYVSATGRAYGFDRKARMLDGWPYQLREPTGPAFREDGMLRFISGSGVVVLDRRGRPVRGWPYRAKGTLDAVACDTPGFDYQLTGSTPDGRLYLVDSSESRSTIVALEGDGRASAGWPYRVPGGWSVTALSVDANGVVRASLSGEVCGSGLDDTSLTLTSSGEIDGDLPGTPLRTVYEALRLDRPQTSETAYVQGSEIALDFELVNRSSKPVTLPRLSVGAYAPYATGTLQTWLERLGPDPGIDCLSSAARKGGWYAIDRRVDTASEGVTIPVGGSLSGPMRTVLPSDLTACLSPGSYRFHVAYVPLTWDEGDEEGEVDWDEMIDEASVDFTIESSNPSSSQSWTPSPSPMPTPRQTPSSTPRPTPSPSPSPTPTPALPSPTMSGS